MKGEDKIMDKVRRKFCVVSEDEDWFVQKEEDNTYSFTGEIEVAHFVYGEDSVVKIYNKCKELGMPVKIARYDITYHLDHFVPVSE